MHQQGSKYIAIRLPSPALVVGSKGQKLNFSEHGHVAYQINGNDKCSSMQAHAVSLHAPSTPGVKSKVKTI